MIEMQYNFPLLPELPGQWRERLRQTVDAVSDEDFAAMRPTFRQDLTRLTGVAAEWLGVPAARTAITEGSHHGSLLSLMAGGLAGKPLAVDAAAYSGVLEQARALGCPLVGCAIDAEGMLPESLREHCERGLAAGQPVGGLFLTVTVHNPLGFVASEQRRLALVAIARQFGLFILEDDTYGFMEPEAPARMVALAPERTFFFTSLSKMYAPATRTGFLAAPHGYVDAVRAALKNTTTGTSSVHNAAAISLIADGSMDRVLQAKLEEGRRRNAGVRALLPPGSCWPGAAAAWHLWASLPGGTTAQAFEARMAERGVAVSGGNWFAAGPGAPSGFRIALGGELSQERMMEGARLVAEAMRR